MSTVQGYTRNENGEIIANATVVLRLLGAVNPQDITTSNGLGYYSVTITSAGNPNDPPNAAVLHSYSSGPPIRFGAVGIDAVDIWQDIILYQDQSSDVDDIYVRPHELIWRELKANLKVSAGSLSQDLPASLTVRRTASRSLLAYFSARVYSAENLLASFTVRQVTSVDLSASLSIRRSSSQELLAQLQVANSASENLHTEFTVRPQTSVDLLSAFNARQSTSEDLLVIFAVRFSAFSDLKASLQIPYSASEDLHVEFTVRHAYARELLAQFIVGAFSSVDLLSGFTARQSGSQALLTGLMIRQVSSQQLKAGFDVGQGAMDLSASLYVSFQELSTDELTILDLTRAMAVEDNDRELLVTPSRRLGRSRLRSFDVR